MNEFVIENPLLRLAFFGGRYCRKSDEEIFCNGYFNSDVGDRGRNFIEYCVSSVLGVHRLPGCQNDQETLIPSYYFVCDETLNLIEDAVSEMRELIRHTQYELQDAGALKDGCLPVIRTLREFEIRALQPQLMAENDELYLPANIVTSYAYDLMKSGYNSGFSLNGECLNVWLRRDIPVEDIVFHDMCVSHALDGGGRAPRGESEVLVAERDIRGYHKIKATALSFSNGAETYLKSEMASGIGRFPLSREMDFRRPKRNDLPLPCELNGFTKWIIQRNKKKIEDIYGNV